MKLRHVLLAIALVGAAPAEAATTLVFEITADGGTGGAVLPQTFLNTIVFDDFSFATPVQSGGSSFTQLDSRSTAPLVSSDISPLELEAFATSQFASLPNLSVQFNKFSIDRATASDSTLTSAIFRQSHLFSGIADQKQVTQNFDTILIATMQTPVFTNITTPDLSEYLNFITSTPFTWSTTGRYRSFDPATGDRINNLTQYTGSARLLSIDGMSTSEVGAVPEPSTWAMLLVGFGFLGGAMRRAKRRQTVAVSLA